MTNVVNVGHVSATEGVLPRVRPSVVAAAVTIKCWASGARNNRGNQPAGLCPIFMRTAMIRIANPENIAPARNVAVGPKACHR